MTHSAFYSTAAQVIPVMWIVLVFQFRFFGDKVERDGLQSVEPEEMHRQAPTWSLIFIVFVGFLLWSAELDALYALLDGKDSNVTRQWVILALVGGGSLFFGRRSRRGRKRCWSGSVRLSARGNAGSVGSRGSAAARTGQLDGFTALGDRAVRRRPRSTLDLPSRPIQQLAHW